MSAGRTERGLRAAGIVACLASLGLAAGCADDPVPGPGVLTATVESPNGAEGAALLTLVGDRILEISPLDGRVFSEHHGDTVIVVVVVVNEAGGELSFGVEVTDTTRRPLATLLEVSGPDDKIRGLSGYSVDIRR